MLSICSFSEDDGDEVGDKYVGIFFEMQCIYIYRPTRVMPWLRARSLTIQTLRLASCLLSFRSAYLSDVSYTS